MIYTTNKTYKTYKSYTTHRTNRTYRTYTTYIALIAIIAAFFYAPMPARAATLTKAPSNLGLVGYWPLDDGSGYTADDLSGGSNPGTLSGGVTWTTGKRGKALSFDGSSSYVDASGAGTNWGNVFSSSLDFTLSAWIKPTNIGYYALISQRYGDAMVFGMGDGVTFPAGRLFLNMDDTRSGSPYSTSAVTAGVWQHVAVTFKGSDASSAVAFYINGQLAGTGTSADGNGIDSQDLLYLGWQSRSGIGGPDSYYNGQMDDARVYSRAFTAAEISSLYRTGQMTRKAVSERGLVGYWPLNEGRGITAGDSSGNGNTGTITGASWAGGKRGNALSFNGTSNCVSLGTSSTLRPQDGTYAAWIKLSSLPSDGNVGGDIFSNYSGNSKGMFLSVLSNGYIQLRPHPGGTVNSAAAISVGQWYHVVGTIEGTATKVYINGALSNSSSGTYTPPDGMNASIGCWADVGAFYFPGLIDDVRVYNRALSATEIQNLYKQTETTLNANTNNRLTSGLVGLWSFNGNNLNMASTTAEILDMSGNGNNGDNSGGRADAGKIGQGWSFDGVDDTINVGQGASFNGLSAMTFSAWIKVSAFTSSYRTGIVSRRPGLNFVVTGINGSPEANYQRLALFDSGGPAIYANTILTTNEWYHAAVSINGTSATFYLNGGADGSGTLSYSWTSNVDITLGSIAGISGYYFNGILDEVRIYNRALSADEIKQLYNMGK